MKSGVLQLLLKKFKRGSRIYSINKLPIYQIASVLMIHPRHIAVIVVLML